MWSRAQSTQAPGQDMAEKKHIRITHGPSQTVIAEGPLGWGGITPFEGNYYIRRRYLKTDGFRSKPAIPS